MANITVVGGKVDDRFHAEINECTTDGYHPILMNRVVKDDAKSREALVRNGSIGKAVSRGVGRYA